MWTPEQASFFDQISVKNPMTMTFNSNRTLIKLVEPVYYNVKKMSSPSSHNRSHLATTHSKNDGAVHVDLPVDVVVSGGNQQTPVSSITQCTAVATVATAQDPVDQINNINISNLVVSSPDSRLQHLDHVVFTGEELQHDQ